MSMPSAIQMCLIVRATEIWKKRYAANSFVHADLDPVFKKFNETVSESIGFVEVVDLPSQWQFAGEDPAPNAVVPSELDRLVVTIVLRIDPDADPVMVERLLTRTLPSFLIENLDGFDAEPAAFAQVGIDLPIRSGTHWCPGTGGQLLFGTRSDAGALIGKPYLHGAGIDLRGRDVNVVVIDQGVHKDSIPTNFAGGWTEGKHAPGTGAIRGHGTMVARNILDIAPQARIFDCPLIPQSVSGLPPQIENLPAFLGSAFAAWLEILLTIAGYKATGRFPGPWILVNAWALYDRSIEFPRGAYTNNRNHFFNWAVKLSHDLDLDVVFCAGNCGLFCPDMRCGQNDQGPRQSILGANSLDQVLTVGAVRNDATWLGYSSQGPGQPELGSTKPDLCAPTQFSEDLDGYLGNIGTSAAAAMAAGVVAALREAWDSNLVPPDVLKQILVDTARKTQGTAWNGQIGHGIIDAHAAYCALDGLVPAPKRTAGY